MKVWTAHKSLIVAQEGEMRAYVEPTHGDADVVKDGSGNAHHDGVEADLRGSVSNWNIKLYLYRRGITDHHMTHTKHLCICRLRIDVLFVHIICPTIGSISQRTGLQVSTCK
jgi:hypothetical protein